MGIRKIKQITLRTGDKETFKVGGSYSPGDPNNTVVVTRITREPNGGYRVYNDRGGKIFFDSGYVDQSSIVKGW